MSKPAPKNRPQVGQTLTFTRPEERPLDKPFIEAQRRELAGEITVSEVVEAPAMEHGFLLIVAVDGNVVTSTIKNETRPSSFSPTWFHYDGE